MSATTRRVLITLLPAAILNVAAAAFAQELPELIPPSLIPRITVEVQPGQSQRPTGQPTTRSAEPPVQSQQNLRQWFAELADVDPAVRERARFNLMGIGRGQLDELRQIVSDSRPLAPSQSAVLKDVVTHVYLSGEVYAASNPRRGFLGVMLENVRVPLNFVLDEPQPVQDEVDEDRPVEAKKVEPPLRGVLIRDTVPGFCAFRFLQPGDLVTSVGRQGGDPAPTQVMTELKGIVSVTPPGEMITLEVLRQGKQTQVTFPINAAPRDVDMPLFAPEEFRNSRGDRAEAYWLQAFAPLVDVGMS